MTLVTFTKLPLSSFRIWVILAGVALCATMTFADDPPPNENAAAKELQKLYLADAEAYEFFTDADQKQPLIFTRTPIMRWAQPDDWSGDVFLWTHQGRPEVVGCILTGPGAAGRMMFHEFHALTLESLPTQQLPGGRTWTLSKPAIELQLLKDAPPPADTAAARLTQMRALSREFTAIMQASDQPWELRLLPQPVYRYERPADDSTAGDWLDGALFTFVWTTGTDAEVMLVVEARRHDGEYRWHYAPTRFTNREVAMKHRDQQVWQVPTHAEQGLAITRPYTTFYVRSLLMTAEMK